jgi:protein O-mannosyl-transferase
LTESDEDSIDSTMSNRALAVGKVAGLGILLAALVWLVFGQTVGHQFVNFDDESYVYANPVVSRGLTWPAIGWAFTHIVSHNWHPLTTISHMIDSQLFDLKPGGHHFTNVMLHTVAAVLLLIVAYQMTGALWRSAFVAAIFAIHPLHVESVAWVAERKDVLSAVFFILTLGAYVHFVRRPTAVRYLTLSILFALGLMSKPMLVTVPFVLLLLDYWPLQRFKDARSTITKLVAEKIPLFILSVPVAVITVVIQRHGINSIENLSLPWRIGNAFVSLLTYIRQMVWPLDLAVFYPHLGDKLPLWQIAISSALLIAITAAVFILRKEHPYFLTGWLWYIGMLAPVIGIVQVGSQAHADRYTYLPQIGLYLAITWGIADFSLQRANRELILRTTAVVVLGLLTWRAWTQASFWRDSESLWNHALTVADDNDLARERLASALLDKDRPDEAIVEAQLAVNLKPDNASAENDFGVALARRGQPNEALAHFWKALALDPDLSRLHYNIANALAAKGETAQATAHYRKQLEIDPNFAEAHNNLATLLLRQGQLDEAADHLAKALQLKPNYPEAHNNFAIALSQKGRIDEAVAQWEKTLSIDADNLDAHCNLAWVLATSPTGSIRNGSMALEHAQRALRLSGESNARIWRLVAAADAELGRFDAAIDAAEKGLRLAESQNDVALIGTLESNIALFQNASPLRDIQTSPR